MEDNNQQEEEVFTLELQPTIDVKVESTDVLKLAYF
jgi:hypothetical protein